MKRKRAGRMNFKNGHKTNCYSFATLILCIVSLVALSCSPGVPGEYIQPDELEDILYDYYVSQAMASQGQNREQAIFNRNVYFNAVLKKHGITEAELDSSMVYYYSDTKRLYNIYLKLSERIGNDAMGLGASVREIGKYSQLRADGDTANIWQESQTAILMPLPPYNRVDFSIKADSTFMCGDSFLFNFMTEFMYQSGTKDAVVYVAIRYDNDSISTHSTHVGVSGLSQLRIPANASNTVESIDGFIYLSRGNDESQTLKLMFISQIQFVRFHAKKTEEEKTEADSILIRKPDSVSVKPLPRRDSADVVEQTPTDEGLRHALPGGQHDGGLEKIEVMKVQPVKQ